MGKERSSLSELTIRGIGVIESAELEFKPGLTVLTGETGAGKTMVLTALNLILGSKSDADFVRKGSDRLVVSGKFKVGANLADSIEQSGGIVEDGEVIISRVVTSEGKSKITLGGVSSTATQVSELSQLLIEIHAQSSSARLAKSSVQRELLDSYGGYETEISAYETVFHSYQELGKRIKELRKQLSERDSEIDRLKEFISDFSKLTPEANELEMIDNEISRLGSVEALNTGLSIALSALLEDENSAANAIQSARKAIDGLKGKDSDLDILIEQYGDLVYNFGEISSAFSRYLSKLEADPQRFEYLQSRKSDLNSLLKRYGKGSEREVSYQNLLIEGADAKQRLQDLSGGDARLVELEKEALSLFTKLSDCAKVLTQARTKSSKEISKAITAEVVGLAMANAQVQVEITSGDYADIRSYSNVGVDEVSFLFTSHKDGNLLPISKAASGGELSRVMLALEVVLAKNSPVGTYIFDEVDAGVGGKAAVEVGRRLAALAKSSQVIVVTHLAQVAAWADNHLVVSKSENGSVTQSNVSEVTGEARKQEVARLLSGQDKSLTAQEHAAELLAMVQDSR
ncbi:MAG: DNA repair protein RecN [Actinobacteria bacterium]|nr:DNA repair protein RecN [Actinomycetota bacterium]